MRPISFLVVIISLSAYTEEHAVNENIPPKFTNALAKETSPYLLQHAHNPVNWYPWGEEAFAKAKKENKPIFLSVGYSSCHWCHVMEHESFENEAVAKVLNDNFVAIKVDREERPDVDEIYMTAVQIVSGRGGWPMSVFMTHEGKPFFGGTYYPPNDMAGRMGFVTLLKKVNEVWTKQHADVLKDCENMSDAVRQQLANRKVAAQAPLDKDFLEGAVDDLFETFDQRLGGFGRAPKFPPNNTLPFLNYMKQHARIKNAKNLDAMISVTLDQMALGGMHDQLGGGFHRYSTDERWFLPHFEKMLYDNAMLARSYAEAAVLFKNPEYERVARDVCDWVLREMTAPEGGFYSTLDADSDGHEGKFYIWSKDEVENLLGADAPLFCQVYNVEDDGNFREEHNGKRTGASILFLRKPVVELSQELKLEETILRGKMDAWKKILMPVRIKRVWPAMDDKILTAWNGLMIAALARTSVLLNEPRYQDAAINAAEFLLKNQRTADGRWLATHRKGQSKLPAYLDDHAFVAGAMLELYDATKDARWKNEAIKLVDLLDKHFADNNGGGYFFTSDDHEKLLARTKDPVDKAIPSGNGWAAQVLVRLWKITGEERYHTKAQALLKEFLGLMQRIPHATESLLLAAAQFHALEQELGIKVDSALPAEPKVTRGAVSVELLPSALKFKRGANTPVAVKFTVAAGSHIQAHKPDDEFFKPTRFALASKNMGEFTAEKFPDPKEITLGELGKIKVYTGEVIGSAELAVPKNLAMGPAMLRVKAHFQSCDEKGCDQPQDVMLSIIVEIVD